MTVDRRAFLKGSTAAAAGLVLGGPFQGFVARAAGAGGQGRKIDAPPLVPTADLRDKVSRLALPRGFEYRTFDPTGAPMVGGTVPGNHDGMGAFAAGAGAGVVLIRNHERNGSTGAFTTSVPTYDIAAPGGDTRVVVDLRGNVTETRAVLAGTQMNCAGGVMPWDSWLACEETINGPDVFDDFTRNIPNPAPNGEQTYIQNTRLTKTHGYVFEVPVSGTASGQPITQAGRFSHEATAFDPLTGSLFLTEDDFGYGSGFYRYDPPVDPRTAGRVLDGGTLWMLAVVGKPQANLSGAQQRNRRYPVRWVRIENPNPQFPTVPDPANPGSRIPTTTNNLAISNVGKQGYDAGGAVFSRLEGIVEDAGVLYFTSTQGGGDPEVIDWVNSAEGRGGFGRGFGQVWAYHPKQELLEVVYQSTGSSDLHLPDNVTVSPRGTLVLCEDNTPPVPTDGNKLQALTARGQLIAIAEHLERPNVEWAGATFSPDGTTLFANLNTGSALSVAIWGPWETVGV